ncbi:MAG: methyltransferase [Trueperaceae bacterium]
MAKGDGRRGKRTRPAGGAHRSTEGPALASGEDRTVGESIVETVAERMVHGGVALARLGDGRIAMLRGAIPGERVRAAVTPRRGVLEGDVLEALEPSPDRVPAPAHPGLDYGHVAYPRQLQLKREVVADALRRALDPAHGQDDADVPPVRPAPNAWGYRSTVQPACVPAGLGYRRPRTGEVVVLGEDPVASTSVNRAWAIALEHGAHRAAGIHELAIRANDEGDSLLALVSRAPARKLLPLAHALVAAGVRGVALSPYDPRGRFRSGVERLAGARTILQRYGDLELSVGATSFAQPNPVAAGELYRALVSWAGSGEAAWELYAGGGVIAMHLARQYAQVTALELDRSAIARGERDAERLGIANVRLVRGDARSVRIPEAVDLVVVDPPRAGLAAELRAAIVRSHVPRLLYVSCDVATWARDVADFAQQGLRLERFEPFDFYPQTHHVEVLSLLSR